ncbi:MAG: spondin domain-containing protein [Verrucomicrobiota bacterium]
MTPLNKTSTITVATAAIGFGLPAEAQESSVTIPAVVVTIENMSPYSGSALTPMWVGFHGGEFDSYDGGQPADALPIQGSVAIERIAEDGDTGPITADFATVVPDGVQGVVASNGPIPPINPGQSVSRLFEIDPALHRYFSYAAMVLPSNDAFIANGSPFAHEIFDGGLDFVGDPFFVSGDEANDAGTEVNDEIPANTAFFGQATPDTGIVEGGVITAHPGFSPPGSGGILDDPRFLQGDFLLPDYNFVRFSFAFLDKADPINFSTELSSALQTPAADVTGTPGGTAFFFLRGNGERLLYFSFVEDLESFPTGAAIRLGPIAQAGAEVASLRSFGRFLFGVIDEDDVAGPLADTGAPMDALIAELIAGNAYVNVSTLRNPEGEVRGQIFVP